MGNADGNAHSFRRWAAAAALAGLSLTAVPAFAERVSRSEFNAFMDIATGATKHTVGTSSNGVPLATRGVPGPTQVGNMNFGHAPGGWPAASASTDIPSPLSGKPLTATAEQSFTKASTGQALGRFAAKVLTPLAVGVAIYDLAQELGWGMRKQGDQTQFYQEVQTVTCNANYGANPWAGDAQITATKFCVPSAAGSSTYAFGWSAQSGYYGWPGVSFPCGNYSCKTGYVENLQGYTTATVGGYEIAKTEDEFAALIAGQSGWPSTSVIDKALADAMNSGLVDLQKSLDTENAAAITAPSNTVTSDPKTETLSDGTTKTSTTTCEWVQGIPPGPLEWRCWDNVTTVTPQKTTTETVVKSNPDGTTSTETITKTTPSTTLTGTTTASSSELDEKLCPDGSRRLVCSELDTVSEVVPTRTETISYAAENLGFGGGSCPAPYGWTDSLGSHSINLAPFCDVMSSVVRPLVLAIAALMAVFIVLPRET